MQEKTPDTAHVTHMVLEKRAMNLTRWANLGMGLAGAVAAWLSNSQALLIDGLFSLIGYISAVFAMRISQTAHLGPDRQRPFGYAADEALCATFRSLALIGLVIFGISQAILGISDYVLGGDVEAIRLEPVAVYTVIVAAACFWLAGVHHSAWKRTGRRSDMLKLEAQASVYDSVITVFAGAGLLSTPYLKDTLLEPIAPVMDSVMVLILCSIAILSYFRAFRKGMAQLAGAPASPADQLAVWHALRRAVADEGGEIVDLAVVRLGRKLDTVVYYNPNRAVTADELDQLTGTMADQLTRDVGPSAVMIVVSNKGRD
ncbi:MAG: cation transporter [Roseibium sp.]|uniref:cation transporter n=1 Tax=Roseibium sp. TaxID=1936156 RepID=UPI003D9C00DA